MSSLKVTNLQHASAASPAIVLASDSTATLNGLAFPTEGSLSGRNRIINGDMRIDQRNAGAAVSADGAFPVDRFLANFSTDGAFSAQQNSSAPTGFNSSIKWTTTTADATLGATQYALLRQKIEGLNTYDLGFGSATAKTVTLSFWVRSSLTGNFGGSITNSAQNRCYPFSYNISTPDTWEYKTLTIPGDTTGTWLTTNGIGLDVFWGLGVGSTYSGTAGSWSSTSNLYSFTGAVSVIGTLNATFYITGVQLEAGSVATPFERRSYGQELALCQRYCVKYGGVNAYEYVTPYGLTYVSGSNYVASVLPVEMRAAPTVTWSTLRWSWQGGVAALTALAVENASTKVCGLQASTAGGETAYRPGVITANNSTSAHLTFSAEL